MFYTEDESGGASRPRAGSGQRESDEWDEYERAVLLVTVLDAFAGSLEQPREEPLEDLVPVREEVGDTSEQEEERKDGEKVAKDAEREGSERRHAVEADGKRYRAAEFEDGRGGEDDNDEFGRQ